MEFLSVLAAAFFVGIVVGITGMGGGALMTPVLLLLGINPTVAVANDLTAAAVNKSVGAVVHWSHGTPDLRLVRLLMIGSIPSAFMGAFIISAIGPTEQQDAFLKLAIGIALLLAAASYVLRLLLDTGKKKQTQADITIRTVPTVLAGAFGGLLVGLTSVGAGSIIMVILLLLYPALSVAKLVGTDLMQAVPLVVAAAIGHVLVNGVEWGVLVPLLAGGVPGTYLGAKFARRLPARMVRRAIIVVLTLTGLSLLGVPPMTVGLIGALLIMAGHPVMNVLRRNLTPYLAKQK